METLHRCPRCGLDKERTAFRWSPKGRRSPYCLVCTSEYKRAAYKANPELRAKAIESARRRAVEKAVEVKAYQDEYRRQHRQELNRSAVAYRRVNAELIREKDRIRSKQPEVRERNRLRMRERLLNDPEFKMRIRRHSKKTMAKWYATHRLSILEEAKRRYWADPEGSREKVRRSLTIWRAAHPDVLSIVNSRRKAIRRGAIVEGFDEARHYVRMALWQQNRCYHCDVDLKPPFHRDHLVPLTRKDDVKGRHEAANLVMSCGRCNTSKHAKLLWREWKPPLSYRREGILLQGVPATVLSTFVGSKRGYGHLVDVIAEIRQQDSANPLFFDWEWFDRRSAIENILAARNGQCRPIGARNTTVAVLDTDDARSFLEAYHIQGFGRGTVYLGLIHGNDLVGVSSWLVIGGAAELNRLAFKGRVQGGFGRMLKTFRRDFQPAGVPILSYVDPRIADGHSYSYLGFENAGETASPVYYYVGPGGMYHRRMFTRNAMKERLSFFDPGLSEPEIARVNGYYQMVGMRQKRFILR